ncbi:WG repeat-containing protein [Candidatus Dependentiae bacterium]|nr:WG repeat-containing protein [Candidatus Dependentiae bacterium]
MKIKKFYLFLFIIVTIVIFFSFYNIKFKYKIKYGILSDKGKLIIMPYYDDIINKGNVFLVEKKGKYGIYNLDGTMIGKPIYDKIIFVGDNIILKKRNYYYLMCIKGNVLIKGKYEIVKSKNKKIFIINDVEKKRIFNIENRKQITKQYDDVQINNYDFYSVKINGKWGIINSNGDILISLKYDGIKGGKNCKYFSFKKENKWGFINKYEDIIAKPIYDNIKFTLSYIFVTKNNKVGILDNELEIKVPIFYDEIKFSGINDYWIVKENNKFGLLSNNIEIIKCKYNDIKIINNVVMAKDKSKLVLLNLKGEKYYEINCFNMKNIGKKNFIITINLKNGFKYGFIDLEKMLAPKYFKYLEYIPEWDLLKYGEQHDEHILYGIMGLDTKKITETKYLTICSYKNDTAIIAEFRNNNIFYGFINNNGEVIIPLIYDGVNTMIDNIAPFKKSGKWGYLNKNNEWVIEPKFFNCGVFHGNIAPVRINKKEKISIINKKGKILFRNKFDSCDYLENKTILVGKKVKYLKLEKK